MKYFYLIIIILFLIFICGSHLSREKSSSLIPKKKTNVDILEPDTFIHLKTKYITGDFDGDGRKDTLLQANISSITHKSIDSLPYPSQDYYDLQKYLDSIESDIILKIKNRKLPALHLGSGLGLLRLINIGDNNHDNRDEIALIIDDCYESNITSCDIYTLCRNKWLKLKTITVFKLEFVFDSNVSQIKGFLEYRQRKWMYSDYQDRFNSKTDKDTMMQILVL